MAFRRRQIEKEVRVSLERVFHCVFETGVSMDID